MFFTPSVLTDLLLLSILLMIFCHSVSLYRRRRWFVFDPLNFFWVGAFVIYIQQPISYYKIFENWYGDAIIAETLFWVAFGMLFLIIGYEAGWGRRWGKRIPKMPSQLSLNGLSIASLVIICAGLIGWKMIFDSGGGLHAWAAVPRGGENWEKLSGYATGLSTLVPVGVSLLALSFEMYRAKPVFRIIAWLLMAGVLLWMLYLGSRSRVIFTVVAAFQVWYLPRRKNPSFLLLLPVFLALTIVTSFQQYYRSYFHDFSFHFEQINWTEAVDMVLPSFLTGVPKDTGHISKGTEFSCTAAVIKLVPQQVDYNYGYSELEFLTHPIPRALWPEKRYPHYEAFTPIYFKGDLTNHWVTHVYRPFLGGPSFGYIGHWYAVGGGLMLVIAGFFTGSLLRAIRSIYDRSGGYGGDVVLFMVLSSIGFTDVTGVPFFWLFAVPLTLIPLIILVNLVKRKERRLVRSDRKDILGSCDQSSKLRVL